MIPDSVASTALGTCKEAVLIWRNYIVQAAEKAAAQSDREINGYRIESISVTHDRHTHYQRQSATPSQVPCPLPCSWIHILSGATYLT